MSWITRHVVDVTTNGSGDGTGYSSVPVAGAIHTIRYVADGSAPFDNTADVTVTAETSGLTILTVTNLAATATWMPRPPVQDEAAADALFAAGGTKLRDRAVVAQERVKVVVAQGGATKSGRFHVYIEGG